MQRKFKLDFGPPVQLSSCWKHLCTGKDSVQISAPTEVRLTCEIPSKRPRKWHPGQHNLSEVLKFRRLQQGLSQIDAARRIGVETCTYRLWEWGRTYPDPKHSEAIKRLLGAYTGLLHAKYTEYREKVWTSREVSKMLELNHHTFEDWLKKSKRFQPRYSISGKRIIFTKKDIQKFKKKLGKRIKAVQKGEMVYEWKERKQKRV